MSEIRTMPEPLFKLMGRSSPRVEKVHKIALMIEDKESKYQRGYSQEKIVEADDYSEVGIEIEIENIKSGGGQVSAYPVWTVKPDGSLRNNGVEFVTTPIRGDRIWYALNWFFAHIDKGYSFSPRTSIHVHMNVLNLTGPQIGLLTALYLTFERLLYNFVGGDRDKNNFCVPFGETCSITFILERMLHEGPFIENYDRWRYLGLNFDALRKFGTLEFRHLGGTDDKDKIVRWIQMLLRLKAYVIKNNVETGLKTIQNLNTDSQYRAFHAEVWGDLAPFLTAYDLQKEMAHNVSIIKRLITVNEFTKTLAAQGKNVWWMEKLFPKVKKTSMAFSQADAPVRRAARRIPAPPRAGRNDRVQINPIEVREPAGGFLRAMGLDVAIPEPQPARERDYFDDEDNL